MSVALSSSLYCEIGDFDIRDKARNAFLTQGFLPSDMTKVLKIFNSQKGSSLFFSKDKKRQCERSEISVSQRQSKHTCVYNEMTKRNSVSSILAEASVVVRNLLNNYKITTDTRCWWGVGARMATIAVGGLCVFSEPSHLRTRFIAGVIMVGSRCNKSLFLAWQGEGLLILNYELLILNRSLPGQK